MPRLTPASLIATELSHAVHCDRRTAQKWFDGFRVAPSIAKALREASVDLGYVRGEPVGLPREPTEDETRAAYRGGTISQNIGIYMVIAGSVVLGIALYNHKRKLPKVSD